MPAPIMLILPAVSSTPQCSPSSRQSPSMVSVISGRSSRGIENVTSASPWVTAFWMIVSTLMPAAATALKMPAAVPGLSGTSVSVTYASSMVWVMPEMIASSMLGSSRIQVPSVPEKVERTWIGTPWLRANSTDRSCSTRAPDPAISSISSGDTRVSLRASGTIRGSAVYTPSTSV